MKKIERVLINIYHNLSFTELSHFEYGFHIDVRDTDWQMTTDIIEIQKTRWDNLQHSQNSVSLDQDRQPHPTKIFQNEHSNSYWRLRGGTLQCVVFPSIRK